jgi:hypothetical protein
MLLSTALANYQNLNPAIDGAFNTSCAANCTVDGAAGTTMCSCTRPYGYWTTTTTQNDPTQAWTMNFSLGYAEVSLKSQVGYVRAVRGGL